LGLILRNGINRLGIVVKEVVTAESVFHEADGKDRRRDHDISAVEQVVVDVLPPLVPHVLVTDNRIGVSQAIGNPEESRDLGQIGSVVGVLGENVVVKPQSDVLGANLSRN
jgi:hypothetical protein